MMVGTISGAMKLPSAQSRPGKSPRRGPEAARLPSTRAATDDRAASAAEVHMASIQRGSPKNASYQRKEKPGGGKVSARAEEKDIGTTISSGTVRKTRPKMPTAARARRLQGEPPIM